MLQSHSHSQSLSYAPSCRYPSYLIQDNVVYLTIAEKSYPRKLAFSYLDELSKEFATVYGPKVESVRKPYAFVGFGEYPASPCRLHQIILICVCPHKDTFMQKTARLYQDTRTASATSESNLDRLNGELQDVTRIMTKNMEELLWRGDSLDSMYPHPSCLRTDLYSRCDDLVRRTNRDVPPLDFPPVRIRKVSKGSTKNQLGRDDSAVRAIGRHCFHSSYRYLVEILLSLWFDWRHGGAAVILIRWLSRWL